MPTLNKQVLKYFETNQLFPNSQHGFRAKRSTFTAVSSMHEQWLKNKEQKCHQIVAFLDLSAAFDTLSKEIVCQKLTARGIGLYFETESDVINERSLCNCDAGRLHFFYFNHNLGTTSVRKW